MKRRKMTRRMKTGVKVSTYSKKKKYLDANGKWGFEYPIGQKPWK